jgi:hypothetical protein
MTTQNMMTQLEELYARREQAEAKHEQARDDILTPEQRMALVRIDDEHEVEMEQINDVIRATEEQIKTLVLQAGTTIKGKRYQAIWSKPRVSWDDKRLEEYFRANDPDALERMRKVGKPSVSIRQVKG